MVWAAYPLGLQLQQSWRLPLRSTGRPALVQLAGEQEDAVQTSVVAEPWGLGPQQRNADGHRLVYG